MNNEQNKMKRTYRLVKGTLRVPRQGNRSFDTSADTIKQGDVIPAGMLSREEVDSFLESGRIEEVPQSIVDSGQAPVRSRGVWSVDPKTLSGKSMEDLTVMVLEIDPSFDLRLLTNEQAAVAQLTKEWDPAYREDIAKSSDRSRPERLRHDGTKDKGVVPMSDSATQALESAKARAQGDQAKGNDADASKS